MSKILKLQNVKTYSAPFTNGVAIQKGETIRVSDEIAAKVEQGGRTNLEGERLDYWQEMPADTKVDHDYAPDTVSLADTGAAEADKTAPAPAAKKVARTASRQRA